MELSSAIILSTAMFCVTWVGITIMQTHTTHKTSLPGMLSTLKGKVVP